MYKLVFFGVLIGCICFLGHKLYKELFLKKDFVVSVTDNNVDLGSYLLDSAKYIDFKIVNNNSYPIHVERIIPDCDCYSVTTNKNEIEPNDTLVVSTKYDAHPGAFLKKIHIYFKAEKHPLVLFFKGRVTTD